MTVWGVLGPLQIVPFPGLVKRAVSPSRPTIPERRAECGSRIAFAKGKSDRAAARSVLDALEHGATIVATAVCQAAARWVLVLTLSLIIMPCPSLGQSTALGPFTQKSLRESLSNLHEMRLKPGVNDVYFDGIDQQGRIMVAGEQDFDASYKTVFFINTTNEESHGWDIVFTDQNDDVTVEDEYDDGFCSRSIRFMNGELQGIPQTFLFVPTLNGSVYGAALPTATISVETLGSPSGEGLPSEFSQILQFRTKATYRDANEALLGELNLPLPSNYPLGD